MFVTRKRKEIEINGGEANGGVTVEIQAVTSKVLKKASTKAQLDNMEQFRELGGAKMLDELKAMSPDDVEREKRAIDPLTGFDRQTLLQAGVIRWTAEEALTPDNLAVLEADVEDTLAREVLRLSRPELFLTPGEAAAAQKEM